MPLTSGEDVADIIETNLFQGLGEAGKGEVPQIRGQGKVGGKAGSWGGGIRDIDRGGG